MSQNFPNIPDQVPQRGNATSRNIFKNLYLVQGWGFEGEFPNLPKAVVFIAPIHQTMMVYMPFLRC